MIEQQQQRQQQQNQTKQNKHRTDQLFENLSRAPGQAAFEGDNWVSWLAYKNRGETSDLHRLPRNN